MSDTSLAVVQHAELCWPLGGGVMFGSTGKDFSVRPAQTRNRLRLCDEPDALLHRATAASAEVIQGLKDEDYGSPFTVRDPEGNLWSFGTYRGE